MRKELIKVSSLALALITLRLSAQIHRFLGHYNDDTVLLNLIKQRHIHYIYPRRAPMGTHFRAVINRFTIRRIMEHRKRHQLFIKGTITPLASITKRFTISLQQIRNRNLFWITQSDAPSEKYIFFIHGGAYVNNLLKIHWILFSKLIHHTSANLVVPDYPLAPEHKAPESFEMVMDCYGELLKKTSAENIVFMGDSAGGGYCLALAQKLRYEGLPLPSKMAPISPFGDVSGSNPEFYANDNRDPVISSDAATGFASIWGGELDPKDPLISPLYGDMQGLPEIHVFIDGVEVLLPDCLSLQDRIESAGGEIYTYLYPQMWHCWMMIDGKPETNVALSQIYELLEC